MSNIDYYRIFASAMSMAIDESLSCSGVMINDESALSALKPQKGTQF